MRRRVICRVTVEPGGCWGRLVGEDSGQGACRACVDICPEVFEKPEHDQCARAKAGVDPSPHLHAIHRAMRACPGEAIRWVGLRE
jgi:ferredoxin